MSENRPSIPSELRRRVLIEAGHRCAIPRCRHIQVVVHHIVPWERCKEHKYENLIALYPNCHNRADRGDIDRKALRIYKANLRFIHEKFSNFENDVLFTLNRIPVGLSKEFPSMLLLLVQRLVDAEYISIDEHPIAKVAIMGQEIGPVLIAITDKGRDFVDSLESDLGN